MPIIPPEAGLELFGLYWVKRLIGPATDAAAEAARRWTEYKLRNVGRVLERASAKTRDEREGVINARVLMRVLDEAGYSDDPIVVEYLGGVLASSRGEDSRDDRGTSVNATIARLSSWTLRLHYVIYASVAVLASRAGLNLDVGDGADLARLRSYFPASELETMGWSNETFGHALFSLGREGLIHLDFAFRSAEGLRDVEHLPAAEHGLVLTPTYAGVELFMWGLGLGHEPTNVFLSLGPDDVTIPEMRLPQAARLVKDMRPQAGPMIEVEAGPLSIPNG